MWNAGTNSLDNVSIVLLLKGYLSGWCRVWLAKSSTRSGGVIDVEGQGVIHNRPGAVAHVAEDPL